MTSSTQQSINHLENDCQNCKMDRVAGTDIIVCLEEKMDKIFCPWAIPFGKERYCKHPSAKKFVKSNVIH